MFKTKGYSSKIISVILTIMMLLSMVTVSGTAVTAGAATTKTIYFQPTSDWTTANARFAMYLFGNSGNTWVSMSKGSSGYYEGQVPSGYTGVIFVRMNPANSTNNWDNKWNQTADITLPTNSNNLFTLNSGNWDGQGGTWSYYGPNPTNPPTSTNPPTPTSPTSGGDTSGKIYFAPSEYWKQANARFAAYFFNGSSGEVWVSLTLGSDGYYSATMPSGGYKSVIFARMNPSSSTNNWDSNNKWNQTSDQTIPEGKNLFTLDQNVWDKPSGTWSTYGYVPTEKPTEKPTPTPTEKPTDPPTSVNDNSYLGDITVTDMTYLNDYQGNKIGSYNPSGNLVYWNWADSDSTYYYQANNKLYAVVATSGVKLTVYQINVDSSTATKVKTISDLELPEFGGFYKGSDGNFYVVVGQNNVEEVDKTIVVKVIKYDSNWVKQGTCDIPATTKNGVDYGITKPFRGGNCRMDLQNGTLVVHTCREMYTATDGLNHQGNISFYINTADMKLVTGKRMPYASHSFNQFVKYNGGDIAFVDHGDAYPRTVVANIVTSDNKLITKDLFKIGGTHGDNYTGTTVTGFEVTKSGYIVAGSSVPHENPVEGATGTDNSNRHNIYLIKFNKTDNTITSSFIWLTKNNPTDKSKEVSEPRLVKISADRFAVMYTEYTYNSTGTVLQSADLVCKIVDSDGQVFRERTYKNINYNPITQPVYMDSKIIWTTSYNRNTTKLFTIDFTDKYEVEVPTVAPTETPTEDYTYSFGNLKSSTVPYMENYQSGKTGSYNAYNGSYWQWASSDLTYYYHQDDQLYAVAVKMSARKLFIYSMDEVSRTIEGYKTVSLPEDCYNFKTFGSFCQGDDGNFYVAVGQDNADKLTDKVVIKVLKFNSNWEYVDVCDILGGVTSNGFEGIATPLFASNASMSVKDGVLVLHTGRTIFTGAQTNISIFVDTKTMTMTTGNSPFVSNSFNQIVKYDDNRMIFVDHGNAYPRAIALNIADAYGGRTQLELFKLSGSVGDGYTGTTLTGLEINKNNYLVVGSSIPHNNAVSGVTGSDNTYRHNIYLSVTSKDQLTSKFIWLTKNVPTDRTKEVSEPRIVKISDDRYVVMYAEYTYDATGETLQSTTLSCKMIDGNGTVISTEEFKDVNFNPICQPIYSDHFIVWTNTYDRSSTTMYTIFIGDGVTEEPTEPPTEAPTEAPTTPTIPTTPTTPTEKPTQETSQNPTEKPTQETSQTPTDIPSETPSEAPTVIETKDYYVTGDFNLKLTTSGTNKVSGTIALQSGTYKLKLNVKGTLMGYGKTVTNSSNGMSFKASYSSFMTLNATGGTYTFQLDITKNILVIKYDSQLPTHYLIGDLNTILSPVEGKTLAIGTTYLEPGVYKFKLSINAVEFGYGKTINDSTTGSLTLKSTFNAKLTLNATGGNYTFTLNTSTNQLLIKFSPVKDEALDDVHLSGNLNLVLDDNGGSSNLATATTKLSDGTYSFKVYNYGQAVTVGSKVTDNGTKKLHGNYSTPLTLIASGGTYTFIFDKTTNELTITRVE